MQTKTRYGCAVSALLALGGLLGSVVAAADAHDAVSKSPWRIDVSIGAHAWPGLTELEALDGGSFDSVGFNLSGAAHYSVRTFDDSELFVGGDCGFMSNSSSITLSFEDVTVRAMYIGPSMKWVFGREHDISLDLGIMYWDIDFAEVESDYPYYYERVVWKEDAVGGYVGATWDVGAGDPIKTSGVTLNFKAHFVDFGDVTGGHDLLEQTFGPAPGNLEGPIYQLQIGYRMR